MKTKVTINIKIVACVVGTLFILISGIKVSAQAVNTLSVKYLDDFSGDTNFSSKYKEIDKYAVYKYVAFSFENPVVVKSVDLSFVVDNEWYEKNNIKDVIFLRFDISNGWVRIDYNDKVVNEDYRKYQVSSNSIGQYWAVIGVLPKKAELSGTMASAKKVDKKINEFQFVNNIEIVDSALKIGEEIVVILKDPVNVKGISTVTTTTAAISVMALLALLGGPANLWIVLQQILAAFLGIFFSKKRHRSGIVYDANTGMPVSLARVNLVDRENDRIKSTKFTDKNGKYYFLAPEGSYSLEVRKKGYIIIEKNKIRALKALLHESDLDVDVNLEESGVIKKNIAILQEDDSLVHGKVKVVLKLFLKYLTNILFFVGIVLSVWNCYVNPVIFNFILLLIYLLILAFKGLFAKNPKYGIIVNSEGVPEPFATVNILDAQTNKMVSRVISDTKGRYYILLEKGNYILNIKTVEGISATVNINVRGHNILSQKLIIQK